MSEYRVDKITNQSGTAGPQIAGITTFSSTSGMLMPSGNTARRLVSDFVPKNIIDDGLILYLDAGNSASYSGSGTTWTDLSGNDNTGTLTNGPTYSSANGGSIVFDGTNDYVSKSSWTNPPTTVFSIGCWVKFSDNVNDRYVLSFGRDIGGATGGIALFAYGFNFVSDVLIFECGSAVGRVSSGIVPSLDVWYYLTATADATNTRFYLNGELKNTSSQGSGAIASSPTLSVGSYVNNSGTPGVYFHSGNIAQVSIYNRALSPQEISQNFNALRSRYSI